ncbi:MAG: GNAT family N-acetyltransferase [Gammaproteobacteria bacterium]|nr:GNAT family N-acetyltransferase [Gammaproteobacteria bacterium]
MLSKREITNIQFEIPTLETTRLILREPRLSDFEPFAEIMSDTAFRQFLGKGEVLNREMAWRAYCSMIGHWVLRGFGFWALQHKDTGEYVGYVGIHYPEDWPDIEIGWGIVPKYQQGGYGYEAAQRVMQFGFEELELDYLISLIVQGNTASAALAQKLGETHDKTIEMMERQVDVYKITRAEYLAKN